MNTCNNCKHYRTVEDNRVDPHGDCTLYPAWLDVLPDHYCGQWTEQALSIDWGNIPREYNWVAQDEDGAIYGFEDEPQEKAVPGVWTPYYDDTCSKLLQLPPNPNWRNTKAKRPQKI